MPHQLENNLSNKAWANMMNAENAKNSGTRKASRKSNSIRSPKPNTPNTQNIKMMRSSFKRLYNRNPNSYIRSRRIRQGRPSKSPSLSPKSNHLPKRRGLTPEKKNTKKNVKKHDAKKHNAKKHDDKKHDEKKQEKGPKPRAGKVMRECLRDCTNAGCQRHTNTKDCKFIHKGEPEWNMLRPDQKMKKGGFAISSPPPLSSVNTYTSWPGGIDPTARLFNQASML